MTTTPAQEREWRINQLLRAGVELLESISAHVRGLTAPAFLDALDVERRLNLKSKIVARLIKSGEIKSFEIAKGHIRIDPAELERFIAARRAGNADAGPATEPRAAFVDDPPE